MAYVDHAFSITEEDDLVGGAVGGPRPRGAPVKEIAFAASLLAFGVVGVVAGSIMAAHRVGGDRAHAPNPLERLEAAGDGHGRQRAQVFKGVSKLLAPARLELICVDRMRDGVIMITPRPAARPRSLGGSAGLRPTIATPAPRSDALGPPPPRVDSGAGGRTWGALRDRHARGRRTAHGADMEAKAGTAFPLVSLLCGHVLVRPPSMASSTSCLDLEEPEVHRTVLPRSTERSGSRRSIVRQWDPGRKNHCSLEHGSEHSLMALE